MCRRSASSGLHERRPLLRLAFQTEEGHRERGRASRRCASASAGHRRRRSRSNRKSLMETVLSIRQSAKRDVSKRRRAIRGARDARRRARGRCQPSRGRARSFGGVAASRAGRRGDPRRPRRGASTDNSRPRFRVPPMGRDAVVQASPGLQPRGSLGVVPRGRADALDDISDPHSFEVRAFPPSLAPALRWAPHPRPRPREKRRDVL